LTLFPQKFAWWEKEETVFLADCHFGKIAHFRKSGIGIPSHAGTESFSDIHKIILAMKPRRLVILGDLFHSDFNKDFERFKIWISQFSDTQFDMVLGNHDKASAGHLYTLGINVYPNLILGPFFCTHEPDFDSALGFNLCGHLHPAVSLQGLGRQHLKVPCFWKGENHLCFPSFGTFTGSVAVNAQKTDLLFATTGSIIRLIEGFAIL